MTLGTIQPSHRSEDIATMIAKFVEDSGGVVTKSEGLVVKAIRESAREVDFIASTGTIDAHKEIIDQESWRLDHYRMNPVVLYGHQSFDLPIGQATHVDVRNGQLECTIKFSDATERAKEVWALLVEKTLRAVSVGFRPMNGRYEMRGGDEIWVWSDFVLKEISVVAVPANHEALAKTKAAFMAASRNQPSLGAPGNEPETEAGAPGEMENDMTFKTIEEATKAHDEQKALAAEAANKLGSANVKALEAESRAEKAEARATVAEKSLADAAERVKKLEGEGARRSTPRRARTATRRRSGPTRSRPRSSTRKSTRSSARRSRPPRRRSSSSCARRTRSSSRAWSRSALPCALRMRSRRTARITAPSRERSTI